MEIDFHRLRSLFSIEREWRYEEGKLKRRLKKNAYIKLSIMTVLVMLMATTMTYNILKKNIVICDADEEIEFVTFKSTVEEVLKERYILIGPYDQLDCDLDDSLSKGMKIAINRAKPVSIALDDKEIGVYTLAQTVGEVIEEAEIPIGIKDRIEPGINTSIKHTDRIKVIRVEEIITTDTEKIPFENEVKINSNLDKGIKRVIKKGQEGEKEIAKKIVIEDGVEVFNQILKETILKSPVAAIVEEGTKDTIISSRGTVTKFTKAMNMVATAYDATFASTGKHPSHPQYGITRSGLKVRPGIVAVDPAVIPLGTYLYVEGYGEALAADTGGAIKGNKIDLYFESPADVAKYGRKNIKVYVLDKPRYKF